MQTYAITGMTCVNCVRHVTQALESVQGVTGVRVDLDSASAQVLGDPKPAAVQAAVTEAGYEAAPTPSAGA